MLHYLVVFLIIAIIVIIQLRSFADTGKKISAFVRIFPDSSDAYMLEYNRKVQEIKNANFKDIIELCGTYSLDSKKYIYTKTDENEKERTYLFLNE